MSRTLPAVRRLLESTTADVGLALALLALGEGELWGGVTYQGDAVYPGPRIANALVVVPLLTLPLVLRRRRPLVAFALVLGTIASASVAFGGAEAASSFVVWIVAVYSAAANTRRRASVLLAGLAVGAVH